MNEQKVAIDPAGQQAVQRYIAAHLRGHGTQLILAMHEYRDVTGCGLKEGWMAVNQMLKERIDELYPEDEGTVDPGL